MDYMVVGLGNPGREYALTRHNMGWLSLDYISTKLGFKINRLKFKSTYGTCTVGDKQVLFLKPQTFMNNSGEAVRAAADFYKLTPEKILVISDDISLPSSKLRIRRNGSDGGHKGLRSIILHLGTDAFPRLKIGVSDRSNPDMQLSDWVTGELSEQEKKDFASRLDDILDTVTLFTEDGLDKAMAKYN